MDVKEEKKRLADGEGEARFNKFEAPKFFFLASQSISQADRSRRGSRSKEQRLEPRT